MGWLQDGKEFSRGGVVESVMGADGVAGVVASGDISARVGDVRRGGDALVELLSDSRCPYATEPVPPGSSAPLVPGRARISQIATSTTPMIGGAQGRNVTRKGGSAFASGTAISSGITT
jgi:hypothetical protein